MTSDGYPLGADCDLDALVEWRHRDVPQRYVLGIDQKDMAGFDWGRRSGTLWILPEQVQVLRP